MSDGVASPPQVVHEDAHCIAGSFRNVAIAIWEDDTRPQIVRAVGQILLRLSSQYPQGVALLQVVGEHHPPLRGESRAELNRVLKAGAGYIRCSAVVFEGDGFRASAIRGIVAGLVMLTRMPFPHRVFAGLGPAVDLTMANLPPTAPPLRSAELTQAVHVLRARLRHGSLRQTA